MSARSLPPFALFDAWGVAHDGTIGECADDLRRLYARRRAAPDSGKIPISQASFCGNLQSFRLLNRMSLRDVSKAAAIQERRLEAIEAGDLTKMRFSTLSALLELYGVGQALLLKLDDENALLHEIAAEEPLPMQILACVEDIERQCDVLLKRPQAARSAAKSAAFSKQSIEKTIGKNLLWARSKKSVSLGDVSHRSGVPGREIRELESGGGGEIVLSRLVQLANVYEEPCPIQFMFPDYSIADFDANQLMAYYDSKNALYRIKKLAGQIEALESCDPERLTKILESI